MAATDEAAVVTDSAAQKYPFVAVRYYVLLAPWSLVIELETFRMSPLEGRPHRGFISNNSVTQFRRLHIDLVKCSDF